MDSPAVVVDRIGGLVNEVLTGRNVGRPEHQDSDLIVE
jgi:hypothetical protein